MSNVTTDVSIRATVYLDAEEAQGLSTGYYLKAPTEISKARITYEYQGEYRGWVMVGGTVCFFRIKKDGSRYKDEQSSPLWRHMANDELVRKHQPTLKPSVTWDD